MGSQKVEFIISWTPDKKTSNYKTITHDINQNNCTFPRQEPTWKCYWKL